MMTESSMEVIFVCFATAVLELMVKFCLLIWK